MTQPPSYPGSEPDPSTPGPSGQDPYAQNPYGQPPAAPNPYGQPPAAPNPYGQPPAAPGPYGQHPYGQPQYGAPGPGGYGSAFPGGPGGEPRPSQGLAITALVLSFLACTVVAGIVSLVMAVVVLLRSRKDGRNHGKGLAIAAIAVNVLVLLVTAGLAVLIAVGVNSIEDVNDLESGDCFNAEGLVGDGATFSDIDTLSCSEPHDAEVLGTVDLDADEARTYGDDESAGADWCAEATGNFLPTIGSGVKLMYITDSANPDADDVLACIAIGDEGQKLTERVR